MLPSQVQQPNHIVMTDASHINCGGGGAYRSRGANEAEYSILAYRDTYHIVGAYRDTYGIVAHLYRYTPSV